MRLWESQSSSYSLEEGENEEDPSTQSLSSIEGKEVDSISSEPSLTSKDNAIVTKEEVTHIDWDFDGIKEDKNFKGISYSDSTLEELKSDYSKTLEEEKKIACDLFC